MARIRVKKAPVESVKINKRKLYARVAYNYPQYTLKDAAKLPYRDILLLIKTAKEEDAVKMYNMTQISAAPHTKKMVAVKKLSEYFKKLAGI